MRIFPIGKINLKKSRLRFYHIAICVRGSGKWGGGVRGQLAVHTGRKALAEGLVAAELRDTLAEATPGSSLPPYTRFHIGMQIKPVISEA